MYTLRILKGAELTEGAPLEVQLPDPLTRYVVGRDPASAWALPDRSRALSARHCEFVAAGRHVLLRDLSTNGTFVNGSLQRLAGEHRLRHGDRIEIGPYVIEARGLGAHAPGGGADGPVTTWPSAVPPSRAMAPGLRNPAVDDTTPLRGPAPLPASLPMRGGDPAAMLAAAAVRPATPPRREGLTEILRSAAPVDTSSEALTQIRVAPKALEPTAAAPSIRHPHPSPATTPDPVLAALADGLGLPASVLGAALPGLGPAEAARQVALLARLAAQTASSAIPPPAPPAPPTLPAGLQALWQYLTATAPGASR